MGDNAPNILPDVEGKLFKFDGASERVTLSLSNHPLLIIIGLGGGGFKC